MFLPLGLETHWGGTTLNPEKMAEIRRILSPNIFPGLRKLTVKLAKSTDISSKALSELWSLFPTLEDLKITHSSGLYDVAFIGSNGDKPFLALTSGRS